MRKKKDHDKSFWVSYSDLMTSLFFVALILFAIEAYKLVKLDPDNMTEQITELSAENVKLKNEVSRLDKENTKLSGDLQEAEITIEEQKKYIKSLWKNAIIVHFTGPYKPWYKECVNPYKHIYAKYREITPWKNDKSSYLLNKRYKSLYIIIMRHIKNFVARIISYTY